MEQYFHAPVRAVGKQYFTEVMQSYSGAAEAEPAPSIGSDSERRSPRLKFRLRLPSITVDWPKRGIEHFCESQARFSSFTVVFSAQNCAAADQGNSHRTGTCRQKWLNQ